MRVLRVCPGLHEATTGGGGPLRKLIALDLTREQHRAIDAPFEPCLAIVGGSATGKTTALTRRMARAREAYPKATPLIGSARTVDECAVGVLRANYTDIALIDDVEAELTFAQACAPLFALEWEEFARNLLDPEVPGLRSPERFLESSFRLIRRLRDGDVAPRDFLERARGAATEFYAKPPNLADPALLLATKASFRDSLEATGEELLRQYRREIDLAKILAKLYEQYVALVATGGRMTGRDAVLAAADILAKNPGVGARLRDSHQLAFIDDAQDITRAQLKFLRAIFGDRLGGVTLCGDPASALSSIRMSDPKATFTCASSTIELRDVHRRPSVEVQRLATTHDESELIAERTADWIAEGTPPERIAVMFRSVRCVEIYESALLARNVPVIVSGDVNIFADRRALDALALLWNVYDPFRHDYLLRTLSSAAIGLSDASLATLCSEPPDPQRSLFVFDEEPVPTARASRWDPKRDLRLGWNVIAGDRDEALSDEAAARIRRFRSLREHWVTLMRETSFETFVRTVWRDGLARDGEPGSARAQTQQLTLRRLLRRLMAFVGETREATLGDVLHYAQQRMESGLQPYEFDEEERNFVTMCSVEAARGREFDRVIVANVRPGAFPCWYSPEAFIFSPRLGIVPKETAGDAQAARTAKFSYYVYASKAPQRYFERERHAFNYALRRARKGALVTASGRPTRGVTAPELLEELR